MKKLFLFTSTLIFAITLFSLSAISAGPALIKNGFYGESTDVIWSLYDDGSLVVEGSGEILSFADYTNLPYLEIFEEGTVKSLIIKDGITKIGDYAFYGCSAETVEIASTVKTIGSYAFAGCKFESVRLSESVKTLGYRAFYSCTALKDVFIGEKVLSIGIDAFGCCTSLAEINVDGFNAEFYDIDGILFGRDSKELIKYPPSAEASAYQVPEGIEKISSYAFSDCENLEIIVLNEGLITIGDYAFASSGSVHSLEIPYGVEKIGKGAFSYCGALQNIAVPVSVTSIDEFAFSYCTSLKEATLPSELSRISMGTFYHCDSLKKVIVGANIDEIEKSAFGLCSNLQIVLCGGTEKAFDEIIIDEFDNEYFMASAKHFSSHTVTTSPEVLPVCVNAGYTAGTYCRQCEYYLSGHKETEPEYKEHSTGNYTVFRQSTCTAEGEERAYCIRDCGYYEAKPIELKEHKYTLTVTEPTCTGMGYTLYTCSCGDTYFDDVTEALGHNLSDYYIISPPKCTAEGKERADCTVCAYCDERTVAAKGHSYTVSSVVKPTCISGGYSVYKCSCGDSFKSDVTDKLGHSYKSSYTVDKKATCNEKGSKSRHCIRCEAKTDVKEIKKLSHSYSYVINSATLKKDGSRKKTCTLCGRVSSTEKIYKIKSVKLSDTTYVYDGKSKTPTVTVKDSKGKILKEGTDYTLKYQSGRKKTGKYTVKVKFTGKFSGSKTLTFKIIPQNVKKVTSEPSLKSIKLSWSKVKGATGYRIYFYDNKTKKYVAVKDTKNLSYTVRKIDGAELKSGTDYKFAVRAYSDNAATKLFSSKKKKHTSATKPAKASLKKLTAESGKITVKWKKTACDGYELVYATNKSFSSKKKVTINNSSAIKKTLKGMVKGKTYFIKIRGYKIIGGKRVYGYYSDVKKIKAK